MIRKLNRRLGLIGRKFIRGSEKPGPDWLISVAGKGPGKRGHIVADTLLPTQMFPRLPARATFVADTNFVSGTQKMFLILYRNIWCPQQMFPSLRSP